MKRITTLTAVLLAFSSSLALADHFETLAGARDAISIPEGEAVLILFVADEPTLQYQKQGRRPVQFQLGLTRPTEARHNRNSGLYPYPARVERNPSKSQPLALAGPATISLMTDGLVSIQIVTPAAATK